MPANTKCDFVKQKQEFLKPSVSVVMEFYGNLVKTQKLTEVKHERR